MQFGVEDGEALPGWGLGGHVRLAELVMGRPLTLVGSGAPLLARERDRIHTPEGCDARHVARLAAAKAPAPIRPLYLRGPDAKLPGGVSP